MGFWRAVAALFGAQQEPAETYELGQFCSDAYAVQCKETIDRMVDEFLARCREQGRIGNEDLTRPKGLMLGHSAVEAHITVSGNGRGWRFLKDRMFGLYVQNDGYWRFHGYHTWRTKPGLPTVDSSLWSLSRLGGWSDIHPYERNNVGESATGTPQAALEGFKEAIAKWEGRPYSRPLRP